MTIEEAKALRGSIHQPSPEFLQVFNPLCSGVQEAIPLCHRASADVNAEWTGDVAPTARSIPNQHGTYTSGGIIAGYPLSCIPTPQERFEAVPCLHPPVRSSLETLRELAITFAPTVTLDEGGTVLVAIQLLWINISPDAFAALTLLPYSIYKHAAEPFRVLDQFRADSIYAGPCQHLHPIPLFPLQFSPVPGPSPPNLFTSSSACDRQDGSFLPCPFSLTRHGTAGDRVAAGEIR